MIIFDTIEYELQVQIILQLLGIVFIQIMRIVTPSISVFSSPLGGKLDQLLLKWFFHGGYIEHSKVDDHLYVVWFDIHARNDDALKYKYRDTYIQSFLNLRQLN